tara:strand:+ start:943 stop:1350 length:408 start_codon:yes stop_codon:yes gene_type:complete
MDAYPYLGNRYRAKPPEEMDKIMMNYKDGGMTMVKKDGKMVPDFAADGKGKMAKGGGVGMHRMPDGTMMKDSAHKDMKKGGKVGHSDKKKDAPMMQKVATRAVKGHEKRMHGKKMAAGGSIDGCAVKGKTKGRMV